MPLNDTKLIYVVTSQHAGFPVVEAFSTPEAAEAYRAQFATSLIYTCVLDRAARWGGTR